MMIKWIKDLFPICRSLTGDGTRKTLSYFEKINPELKRIKFKSGLKVFDWVVPLEWNIKEAFISKNGKKIVDFKKNNLHIVGYSRPVNKIIDKKELLRKLYTEKKRPNAIPYVTSYYKKDWGFCLSEKQKKNLKKGKYNVFIKSNFTKGNLECSHALIKGKSKKEIFFSSYVCHPSMANNELSGPSLLNAIMLYLKKNHKKNYYSYRFFLGAETIGSISYLSKYKKLLKKNVFCGFNLSCVGDERNYSHIYSRNGNTIADQSLSSAIFHFKNQKSYSFLDRGSDERQYCYPGIDLPLATFCKSKFGEFPEYHTSDDNLKLVTKKGLEDSLTVFSNIIDVFESGCIPSNTNFCEPNMGKRNLYPLISKKGSYSQIKTRMDLLSYADGKDNLFTISKKINSPLGKVMDEYKILLNKKLLKNKYF
jgi:aminopeptidase-like protein